MVLRRRSGSSLQAAVLGPATVGGVPTVCVTYDIVVLGSSQPQERWYFSVDVDGSVYLHAREVPGESRVELYDPPLLHVKMPLEVGSTWTASTTIYNNWAGDPPGQLYELVMTVIAEEDVTVPLGAYRALKVEAVEQPAGSSDTITSWFSDGIGIVKLKPSPYLSFNLTAWSGRVPVEPQTWGAIKQLYR
jgi:hypothetical protein